MFSIKKSSAALLAPFFVFLSFSASFSAGLPATFSASLPEPQESEKSFAYRKENVVFEDKLSGTVFHGTLTFPENAVLAQSGGEAKKELPPKTSAKASAQTEAQSGSRFAAVVFACADKRFETSSESAFISVLADYLTRQGFAVLRYEENPSASGSGILIRDFANNALAALKYLQSRREIDSGRTGLIGYGAATNSVLRAAAKAGGENKEEPQPETSAKTPSQSSAQAALETPAQLSAQTAAQAPAQASPEISFAVLLAPSGVSGDKILLSRGNFLPEARAKAQTKVKKKTLKALKKIDEGAYKVVLKSKDSAALKTELGDYLRKSYRKLNPPLPGTSEIDFMRSYLAGLCAGQTIDFIKYDPSSDLEKIKIPVLALWGEKDLQTVPAQNFKAVKKALKKGGNKNAILKIYKGLSREFQEEHAQTGNTDENVLKDITGFLTQITAAAKY
jgi:pimeloyl-ACP methyl ester carboxylesterase